MDLYKYKIEYKNLKKCKCPYLNDEVHFTSKGFSHLIWKKGSSKRDENEIVLRMNSLVHVKKVIENSGTLQEFEKILEKEYYGFIAIIEGKKYKVVVAKVKDGRFIFVSIIPRWVTGKRDKKLKNPSIDG